MIKIKNNFKEILESKQYDFIRTDPHLNDNILLLTLGGSHAYGTNVETSDIDFRGCALNSPSDLIGMTSFEQFENRETDTVIYAFNKLINLLMNCNPNTIEMLGCKSEHYVILTDIGKQLLDNTNLFLSKKCINSFGGYANQQLRRLQNALARDNYPQPEKEEHIRKSCQNVLMDFESKYTNFDGNSFNLYLDKAVTKDLEIEIYLDVNLNHYPLRQFTSMISELLNVPKSYSTLGQRNHKKDDLHLNKHSSHLVRLYLTCIDLLEQCKIITFREKDIPLLLNIRNGCFQKSDGSYDSSFFDLVNELEIKMQYASKHTMLPKLPDYKKIEQFVFEVNKQVIMSK